MKFVQKLFCNRFYKSLFYILPLLVASYFLFDIYYLNNVNEDISKRSIPYIKKEKTIKLFDFLKDLEKKIKKDNLEVKNLKIVANTIAINIEGDFIKSISIIDFVEKYSLNLNIKKVNFEAISTNKIDLSIEIELTKRINYYNDKISKKITSDILYQKNDGLIKKNSSKKTQMRIGAIIDNSVLIGNTWYKVGSFINDKKIVLIKSDHIGLEQDGNIKKIWMYNNEFTR